MKFRLGRHNVWALVATWWAGLLAATIAGCDSGGSDSAEAQQQREARKQMIQKSDQEDSALAKSRGKAPVLKDIKGRLGGGNSSAD
jgi:hypothetical protein